MKKILLLIGLAMSLTACSSLSSTPGCDSRYENCGRPSTEIKQEISSELNGMVN